ncbi:MAG: LLM class flavin-dependent oxidoreductase, partial [bacterium]|nr:LLM class flavin-dependent oxidoreductase [bacterium]
MEFGVFIQGYTPQFRREGDPDAEHKTFMEELELVIAADKAGFKYVWLTEHHFLD